MRWKDEFYIKVYLLAQDGLSNAKIGRALGTTPGQFRRWMKEKSALVYTLEEGRKKADKTTGDNLQEYIFNRLSPKYQRLWEKIDEVINEPNGLHRVNALFANRGEKAQQHIFVYAVTRSMFNASEACKKVGIPYSRVKKWLEYDPDFAGMMDEIKEHQKNFAEGCLMGLLKDKDTQATLFVNRTLNREKYGEKVEVNVNGNINHAHTFVIDEKVLDLMDSRSRRSLLDAVEEAQKLAEGAESAVPAIGHRILGKSVV